MGIVIRFKEEDVRPVGRTARGVRGISLAKNNAVIGMVTITGESQSSILTVTERGYGKRTQVEEYRTQSRAGKGVISVKVTEKNGPAISFHQVWDADQVMLMSAEGMILRARMTDIREIGRNAQGVRVMDLPEDDRLVGVAKLAETDEGDASDTSGEDSPEAPDSGSEPSA
jgi:DNA gyrase subunit A